MKALNIIFNNLKAGKVYATFYSNVRFPCYYYNIIYNRVKNIFYFSHYGESAVAATKEKLAWVIEVIFNCTPEEFIARYECVTAEEYNRI
jgi:hypothetical protein